MPTPRSRGTLVASTATSRAAPRALSRSASRRRVHWEASAGGEESEAQRLALLHADVVHRLLAAAQTQDRAAVDAATEELMQGVASTAASSAVPAAAADVPAAAAEEVQHVVAAEDLRARILARTSSSIVTVYKYFL